MLSHEATAPNSTRKTRSNVEQVNWNNCIFAQNETPKERLSSFMTFKTSEQIFEASQF